MPRKGRRWTLTESRATIDSLVVASLILTEVLLLAVATNSRNSGNTPIILSARHAASPWNIWQLHSRCSGSMGRNNRQIVSHC